MILYDISIEIYKCLEIIMIELLIGLYNGS